MAKRPTVSDEFAKKFATEKDTPYLRWVRGEGLEVISAQYVANLRTVELKPWPRRGGAGVFINHDASRTSNDCYVCAIPPGGKLAPQRQLYEEMILILEGRGSTSVWNDAGKRITFEWKAGAMFAIPLNCWHQHFNGSGQESARYVGVTNAPAVMNMYDDADFVFNTSYDFKNRFAGEPDYFSPKSEKRGFLLVTNFVADAVNLPLISPRRSAASSHASSVSTACCRGWTRSTRPSSLICRRRLRKAKRPNRPRSSSLHLPHFGGWSRWNSTIHSKCRCRRRKLGPS